MGSLDLTCSQVHCIILTDKEASSGLQTCNSRGQPPLLLNHTLRICSLRKTFYTFYLPSLRTRINRLITKRCLRFDRCTLSCFFNLKLNNWIKVIQFTSCQLSGSKSTETGDFCFVQHFQHSYSFFWHGRESAFFETKNRILIDRTNPDVTSTFFKLLQIFFATKD